MAKMPVKRKPPPQKLEKYFERIYFMTLLKSTMGEISSVIGFSTFVLQFRMLLYYLNYIGRLIIFQSLES